MGRWVRSVVLAVAVVATGAMADEVTSADCAGTQCTCSAGVCPLHRPKPLPTFDPASVTSVQGVVTSVERLPQGLHLKLRVGGETVLVHLGPSDFVDARMTFAQQDALTVTGSRVRVGDQPTLLATRVTRGRSTVDFRQENGTPLFTAH